MPWRSLQVYNVSKAVHSLAISTCLTYIMMLCGKVMQDHATVTECYAYFSCCARLYNYIYIYIYIYIGWNHMSMTGGCEVNGIVNFTLLRARAIA